MKNSTKRPLFIGLPGAGKSFLSSAFAKKHKMSVVATDPLFRVFRAIPASSDDVRAAVMKNFLARAKNDFAPQHEKLESAANDIDTKGRCALHDSTLFRSFGEDVFRAFEVEMLKWLDAQGEFNNTIVDLSASAPLYDANRALFSPQNGYCAILVDTPYERIEQNILKDYRRYVEQSKKAGEKKPIRGAYEGKIDAALAKSGHSIDDRAGAEIALSVAREITADEANKRMEKYRKFAHAVIIPSEGDLPEDMVLSVEKIIAA